MNLEIAIVFVTFGILTAISAGTLSKNILDLNNSYHKRIYMIMIAQSFSMCSVILMVMFYFEQLINQLFALDSTILIIISVIIKFFLLCAYWAIITILANIWQTNLIIFSLFIFFISSSLVSLYIKNFLI